jgi:hypothetical protein
VDGDRALEQATDPGSITGVLRRVDPVWWWLRENFRLPSLVAIAGCLLTSAAWIYSQHMDLEQLKKHDPGPQLAAIATQLSAVLQAQSAMQQRLEDFGERIDRQEARWDRVDQIATEPPRPRHARSR